MIRDVHVGGRIADRYDFHATIVGPRLSVGLLYDGSGEPGAAFDRFFGGGSEIRLSESGVTHSGTGGGFCAYMFGVDIPETDLLKREVRNRLFMHGARYDEAEGRLSFSADTAGSESWARIFNDGHAVANYYFFVQEGAGAEPRSAQERLLRAAGKFLKRVDLARGGRDGRELARRLHEALGQPSWTLFLVKVIDANAEEFYRRFRSLYAGADSPATDERRALDGLSRRLAIDPYQRERIQLDVLYTHDENKKIIDQYKDALAAHLSSALSEQALMPRLNLLRAVLARSSVPAAIFDRLDALLLGRTVDAPRDPEFIVLARTALSRVFAETVGRELEVKDLVELLTAKRSALEQRHLGFEEVLLQAPGIAERWHAAGRGQQMRSHFEQIVAYLDLVETAWTLAYSIAFIDDFELNEERLETLVEARQAFDELRPGLFRDLFIEPLRASRYLGIFGRRRVAALETALDAPSGSGVAPLKALAEAVAAVNETARVHGLVDRMLRPIVGDPHASPLDAGERRALRLALEARLAREHGLEPPLGEGVFDLALHGIEEEHEYARRLLPSVVATRDFTLRDDFLATTSLDLFRVEALESAYVHNSLGDALAGSPMGTRGESR